VEQPLPKMPNGADMFDQLHRRPDGKLMIIAAKVPSSGLLWRKGVGPAKGFMVKQGTEPYLRTIIAAGGRLCVSRTPQVSTLPSTLP